MEFLMLWCLLSHRRKCPFQLNTLLPKLRNRSRKWLLSKAALHLSVAFFPKTKRKELLADIQQSPSWYSFWLTLVITSISKSLLLLFHTLHHVIPFLPFLIQFLFCFPIITTFGHHHSPPHWQLHTHLVWGRDEMRVSAGRNSSHHFDNCPQQNTISIGSPNPVLRFWDSISLRKSIYCCPVLFLRAEGSGVWKQQWFGHFWKHCSCKMSLTDLPVTFQMLTEHQPLIMKHNLRLRGIHLFSSNAQKGRRVSSLYSLEAEPQ